MKTLLLAITIGALSAGSAFASLPSGESERNVDQFNGAGVIVQSSLHLGQLGLVDKNRDGRLTVDDLFNSNLPYDKNPVMR